MFPEILKLASICIGEDATTEGHHAGTANYSGSRRSGGDGRMSVFENIMRPGGFAMLRSGGGMDRIAEGEEVRLYVF